MNLDDYKTDAPEPAEKKQCPRCEGVGYITDGRTFEQVCTRCDGEGECYYDPDYDGYPNEPSDY